jgi:hypothetical protein
LLMRRYNRSRAMLHLKGSRRNGPPSYHSFLQTGLNDSHRLKLVWLFKHSRNQVPIYVCGATTRTKFLAPEKRPLHPSKVPTSPRHSRAVNMAAQDLSTWEELIETHRRLRYPRDELFD